MQFFVHSSSARDIWQVRRPYDNVTNILCSFSLIPLLCHGSKQKESVDLSFDEY